MRHLNIALVAAAAFTALSYGVASAQTVDDTAVKDAPKKDAAKTMEEVNREFNRERMKVINKEAILPENMKVIEGMTKVERHDLLNQAVMEEQTRMRTSSGEIKQQIKVCPAGTTVQPNGTCLITGNYKYDQR